MEKIKNGIHIKSNEMQRLMGMCGIFPAVFKQFMIFGLKRVKKIHNCEIMHRKAHLKGTHRHRENKIVRNFVEINVENYSDDKTSIAKIL